MKILPWTRLLLAFFFIFSSAYSQSYHFKNYKEHGFLSNQIFALHQDKNGFIWLGSGVGLTRYDSNNFLTFTVNDSLPANEILALTSAADSILWVGTGLGLSAFNIRDINKPAFIFTPPDMAHYSISALMYSDDVLWIGTRRNGLFTLKYSNSEEYRIENIFKDVAVKEIYKTEDGRIIVLHEKGIHFYDAGFSAKDSLIITTDERLKCLIETSGNSLMIGTSNGLLQFDRNNRILSPLKIDGTEKLDFNVFSRDHEGVIWAGSDKGLVKFNQEQIELIDRSKGLPGNDLRALLFDEESNLWLGSYTNGLAKLNNTDLINFTERDGLLSNVVNCILSETDTRKLIGTDLGIFKIENYKLSRDPRFNQLNNEIIWFIYKDSRQNIWVGGEDVLVRYNGESLEPVKIKPLETECTFLDMLESKNGTYWLCTTVGLFSIDDERQQAYTEFFGQGIRSVWEAEQLHDGRLLFGTDNGIAERTNAGFKFVKKDNGLPDRAVYVIHQDKSGAVWMGSDLGVIIEKDGRYKLIGENDGLQGTIISQIMSDNSGSVWICSDKGLQKYTPEDPPVRFGLKDGLAGEEFTTQNSSLIDSKGKFWLGVFGGLTIFDPASISRKNIKPRLYFSRANYSGSNSQNSFLYDGSIKIDYHNNNVTFQILGLYYYNETDLTYIYQLQGLDDEWQHAERNELLRYNNLAPGVYTFKVKARVDGQTIEESLINKTFEIGKPFWQQSWFIVLLIALVGLVLYMIFYRRTKRILTENKKLQDQINKNIQELTLARATIENIVEQSGSILVTTDLKGRITTWNKRAEEVFGYNKKDILHKNIKLLDLDQDLWDFPGILKEIKQSGELRQLEIKKKTEDGSLVELIATGTALYDREAKIKLINFSMEDFSERNRLTELRINREKLLAGIEALNKLLATLSHYINNSIASISGMAQLVELDQKYNDKFLNVTNIQVKKIQAVLNSLSILVNQLNLKTKDYVGEKEKLFDIENEIDTFISSVRKVSGKG